MKTMISELFKSSFTEVIITLFSLIISFLFASKGMREKRNKENQIFKLVTRILALLLTAKLLIMMPDLKKYEFWVKIDETIEQILPTETSFVVGNHQGRNGLEAVKIIKGKDPEREIIFETKATEDAIPGTVIKQSPLPDEVLKRGDKVPIILTIAEMKKQSFCYIKTTSNEYCDGEGATLFYLKDRKEPYIPLNIFGNLINLPTSTIKLKQMNASKFDYNAAYFRIISLDGGPPIKIYLHQISNYYTLSKGFFQVALYKDDIQIAESNVFMAKENGEVTLTFRSTIT